LSFRDVGNERQRMYIRH